MRKAQNTGKVKKYEKILRQQRGEKLNFGRQKGGEAVLDKFLALKYGAGVKRKLNFYAAKNATAKNRREKEKV